MITQLSSLKMKYSTLKQKEEDAYEQVKKSVQMVEQAQLEQTQVCETMGHLYVFYTSTL